ncbi:sensor histidine kinase [Haliangium sp.]|uniref:sensor histidine kinase n=1 Tax=Haliangium sp. TaxID=2663208 RepID=UPI003D0EEB95
MLDLPGYRITEERSHGRRQLCRAVDLDLDRRVAIEVVDKATATAADLTRIRQSYAVLSAVEHPGVPQVYGLESVGGKLALIYEDDGSRTLSELLAGSSFSLEEVLLIVGQVARTLEALHEVPILHKGIQPDSILVNRGSQTVKLTGFGLASRLWWEDPQARDLDALDLDLAYISPEQTGRMHRTLDGRSDLYSLGAVFYHLLVGRPPFPIDDPVELIYAHLTEPPLSPSDVVESVPKPVSEVVLKLLHKSAEDRYQSAIGLATDIDTCLADLRERDTVGDFLPGRADHRGRLVVSQALYGRDGEREALVDAFARAAAGGTELVLVSGDSGVGKTALVHELHAPVVHQRGRFATGKFERFKHEIPYSALSQAFGALIREELRTSEEQRAVVGERLREALGTNGRVIAEIIPELTALVGELPPVVPLSPAAARHRFQRAFRQLTHFFAQPEHPLVLFLDDVHWIDSGSLGLLQHLVSDPESEHLLVIAAYRDTAVDVDHPLATAIDDIRAAGAVVISLAVPPLSRVYVGQLVCDTLLSPGSVPSASIYAGIEELVGLIMEKSDGNALHVVQILDCLGRKQLLDYDPTIDGWRWNTSEIRASGCANLNPVEIMRERISVLPADTQSLLRLAACLGASFELQLLAAASALAPREVARRLWPALEAGLVLPLGEAYKIPLVLDDDEFADELVHGSEIRYRFAHDRVQRAAYYLYESPAGEELHLAIGQRLADGLDPAHREAATFVIASQLDLGRDAISDPNLREDVAEIELDAARRARGVGAHDLSLAYTTLAMELLGDGSWFHRHELTLGLYMEAIADAQAMGNYGRVGKLAGVALGYAEGAIERAAISAAQIESLIAQGKMEQVIENTLHVLQLLDVPLQLDPPEGLTPASLRAALVAAPAGAEQPPLPVERELADRILAATWKVHPYMGHETVEPFLYTRLKLCTEGARPRAVAAAASQYATLLCGPLNDVERGRGFGELSLAIVEEFDLDEIRPNALRTFHTRVRPWYDSLQETLEPLRSAIRLGLDHGDPTAAGRAALDYCLHLFWVGAPLERVLEEAERHVVLASNLGLADHVAAFDVLIAVLRRLSASGDGRSEPAELMRAEPGLATQGRAALEQERAITLLFGAEVVALVYAYLAGDIDRALEHAERASTHAAAALGRFAVAELCCFQSLALLAECDQLDPATRAERLEVVVRNQDQMAVWSRSAPGNFQYRHDLVAGEEARVRGDSEQAMELFGRAVQGAAEHGAVHFEAIALERTARLFQALDDQRAAADFLSAGCAAFERWGALAKARQLDRKAGAEWVDSWGDAPLTVVDDPDIDPDLTTPHVLPMVMGRDAITVPMPRPDVSAVITSSQSISREVEPHMVLSRAIEAFVAHTGAERGTITGIVDGEFLHRAAWADSEVHIVDGVAADVPIEILQEVVVARQPLVLADALLDNRYGRYPYVISRQPRSILCVPLEDGPECLGVVYLEDRGHSGVFTLERVEAARMLCAQVAISLSSAQSVSDLLNEAHEHARREREAQNAEAWALAKRTVEMEQFLSLMAHDLKNALNQIVGVADFLVCEFDEYDAETFDLEDTQDLLGKQLRISEATAELLINFLTWRKLQSGGMALKREHRNLFMLAKKTTTLLEDTAESKHISMLNEIDRSIYIHADPNMVDAVVRNLVGNALKFTPPGGQVSVFARPHQPGAEPGEGPPEGWVAVSVQDNGVGIKPEDLSKLFRSDAIHTTTGTANEKGSGFGLTMCKDMIELNGGTIWAESELGKGTTFTFTVPAGKRPEKTQ